jgi:hypothetical protein
MKLSLYASIVVALSLVALPAAAQNTVSGSVTNIEGSAIGETIQVRAWRLQANGGYAIQAQNMVNGSGAYSLSIPSGTYKFDARLGITVGCPNCNRTNGTSNHYATSDARYWRTDRWQPAEVADNRWTQEAAQTYNVTTNITNMNFRLPLAGAATGRVLAGGPARAGMLIRIEQVSDWRRHHNAVTLANQPNLTGQTHRLGRFWSRGLITGSNHRLIVHDPDGNYETFVQAGEFAPVAQSITNRGDITLAAYDANPYGSNNTVATAFDVTRASFGGTPLQWSSSNARIAPRNTGARDVFCWNVFAEERFYVTATTLGTVLPNRYHPWFNPRLRVVHASNSSQIHGQATDEYSGPGPMDAEVDTGRIPSDGRYCAQVTSVGDGSFAGTGQQTSGRYVLRIHMGNRPPFVDVTHGAQTNPATITIQEGGSISLGVTYGDPDGDTVGINSTFVNRHGNAVSGATFSPSGGSGTWSWDVPNVAAPDSPYTVTFTVNDAEFVTNRSVVLNVDGVNFPPTTPNLISPEDGAIVSTLEPTLETGGSTDADGDPIRYEIEVYYGGEEAPDGSDPADESYTALVPSGGNVASVVAGPLPEKENVWWRARAYDIPAEPPVGFSSWTDFQSFYVHALPPILDAYLGTDPAPATLEVDEGDLIVIDLEYSAPNGPYPDLSCVLLDGEGEPVEDGPELDVADGEGTWTWQVGALDSADGPYTLTCTADDGRYETSFDLDITVEAKNLPPSAPILVSPEVDEVVLTRHPTLVATNAVDPEGEATFMHFQVARDVAFVEIVATTSPAGVPQDEVEGQTGWMVDGGLDWGNEYWFRAFATDLHGLAGPYSSTRRFVVRDNSPPGQSTFDGDLGAQCSGSVVYASPMIVPVVHGVDPDDDPVYVHLQVFPYGADPSDGVLIDLTVPTDVESDVTDIEVNVATLPDNTRYTIRVRSYDNAAYSPFTECNFWLNLRNESPSPLVILTPEPGTELPLDATDVTVVVQNAYDPDLVVPGSSLEIAFCASRDPAFSDCPVMPRDWNRVDQSSLNPADTTEFQVNGLTPRERWHIRACALDEAGLCGPMDQTFVVIGSREDAIGAAPGGCCTTARGGEPWMALFAILALGLMAPRTRRRRT